MKNSLDLIGFKYDELDHQLIEYESLLINKKFGIMILFNKINTIT